LKWRFPVIFGLPRWACAARTSGHTSAYKPSHFRGGGSHLVRPPSRTRASPDAVAATSGRRALPNPPDPDTLFDARLYRRSNPPTALTRTQEVPLNDLSNLSEWRRQT